MRIDIVNGDIITGDGTSYLQRTSVVVRDGFIFELPRVQYIPYNAYADRVIDLYDELAPGFRESVLARQVIGPFEMEQEYGLIGGNIFHGELSAEQLFWKRPVPHYADYRSPIRGLYQCGSSAHPGGGVGAVPGHNAAREILRDRGAMGRA